MKQSITFQRVEAAAIFFASLYIYLHLGFNILGFILFILVFDVSMIGYLAGPKVGALVYNLGHSMILPAIVFTAGFAYDSRLLLSIGLLWFAHIGMDRGLGYGLKLTSGFKDTHLGKIGKS